MSSGIINICWVRVFLNWRNPFITCACLRMGSYKTSLCFMYWWKFDWVLEVRNCLLYITGGNLRDSSRQSCLVYVFLLIRHSTRVSSNSKSGSRILLLDNLRIHGKSTLHSETRSLAPFPLSLFSCTRITMNIIFGVSLLVLIINCVAAAPGPLTVSEAKPDTFVVARIPGS